MPFPHPVSRISIQSVPNAKAFGYILYRECFGLLWIFAR